MKRKIWITVYDHRHGSDTHAFASEADANAERQAVAADNWDNEIDENADSAPKPSDPEELADQYWEIMGQRFSGGEYFTINEREIEFPDEVKS